MNATLYTNLNFNFIRGIAPVAGILRVPNVILVNPSFPPETVSELIAYAKANRGKINMATAGIGRRPTSSASCSKKWPVSTCSRCTIAAAVLR
jgi:tripartite-type tricarboxylate transporter receptor subunit TctC